MTTNINARIECSKCGYRSIRSNGNKDMNALRYCPECHTNEHTSVIQYLSDDEFFDLINTGRIPERRILDRLTELEAEYVRK